MKKNSGSFFTNLKMKGFTLIELIIFMGIFSILLLVMSDLFVTSLDINTRSQSASAVSQDSRFILSKLTYDINNANSILYPALGDTADSFEIVVYGLPRIYRLNAGNLEYVDAGGADTLNSFATTVTSASFTRLGNSGGKNTVKISITLESKAKVNGNPEVISFETTAGLR